MVEASYAQERIWLDDQRHPELCMYNIWAGLRIQGDFDPVQLRWALSVMVEVIFVLFSVLFLFILFVFIC